MTDVDYNSDVLSSFTCRAAEFRTITNNSLVMFKFIHCSLSFIFVYYAWVLLHWSMRYV